MPNPLATPPLPASAVSHCLMPSLSSFVYVLSVSQPPLCSLSRDHLGTKGGDYPFHPPSSPHCSTLKPLPQYSGETHILRWPLGNQLVRCCLLIYDYAGWSISVPKRHYRSIHPLHPKQQLGPRVHLSYNMEAQSKTQGDFLCPLLSGCSGSGA